MGQKVKLRRSAVAGKKPLNSQIELGELSVNTTDGKVFLAKSGSQGPSVEEIIITNTQNTGSIDIIGSVSASFFTGSFVGDGRSLYNIPASGVTGLSLDQIANGSSTASIDNDGLHVNVDTSITGSLTATEFTGSGLGLTNVPFYITGSDVNGVTYGKTFTKLQFDDSTGLNVSESAPDTAFISIGSHFRDIFIEGSDILRATGSDAFEIKALGGLQISTSVGDTNSNGYEKELIFDLTDFSSSIKDQFDIVTGSLSASGEGRTAILEVTGATSTWTFNHNLNEQYPAITVFDSDGNVIIPQNIDAVSTTQLVVSFASPQTGVVSATVGGGLPTLGNEGSVLVVSGSVAAWKDGIFSGSLSNGEIFYGENNVATQTSLYDLLSGSIFEHTGSFTGVFMGDGSQLYNIPASGVTGLSLDQIASGGATASISPTELITNVSILPDRTDTIDLGSPTKQWRDLYLSSGSLYINGQQVLSTTGTELRVTTDAGESIKIIETDSDTITLQTDNGDITLSASGTGNIELDAPVQITAGKKILSSDGNSIVFGNGLIITGSIELNGTVDGVDIASMKDSFDSVTGSNDGRLDSLETESGSIRTTFNSYTSSNNVTNTDQNNRLTSLENATGSIIGDFNTYTSSTDNRLDSLETESGSIRSDFNTITSSFDSRLDSLETTSGSHDGRLDSLETESGSIRTTFNSYTSSNNSTNTTQNNRLNSLETTSGSHDGRLDSLETESGSIRSTFNSYTSSNNTTNTTQNDRLTALESATSSLSGNVTTLDGRVGSLETESGSIRSDFNTYTSSNNTTNTNQNNRLSALETESGSIRSDFNTITGSFDGRLDSLETESGSIRTTFNSYTSSNNVTNTDQNNRLSALETESGSIRSDFNTITGSFDGRLDSLETTSGSHNTRITNLETFKTTVDAGLEFTGSNVTIKGDLLVKGTETRVNSTTVEISDNIISLNGSGAANAGIEVRDATAPGLLSGSLIWDGTNNHWKGGTKSSEQRLLTVLDTGSLVDRLDSLETTTGSLDGRVDSLETFSGSADSRLDSIESVTGSYITGYTETDTLATVTSRGASTSTAVEFSGGLTTYHTNLNFGVMPDYQQEGTIKITRTDGTDRSHLMKFYNDGTAGNNYIKFALHNGTVSSTTDVLSLFGDGAVNIGGVFQFSTASDLFQINNNTNTGGLNLSGNNSRIYFGGNRAIEGAQDGSNLTLGEGYSTIYLSGNGEVLGTLNTTGNITATSNQPNIYLKESDTQTHGRIVQSGGVLYLQSSASGYTGAGEITFGSHGHTTEYGRFSTSGDLTITRDFIGKGLYINSGGSAVSGTQVAIVQDGNQNLQRWGSATTGADSYRFRIDQTFKFIANDGTVDNLTIDSADGSITAKTIVKDGGTASQFLMADGSVSTNPGWITGYTETQTLQDVTDLGANTTNAIGSDLFRGYTYSANSFLDFDDDNGIGKTNTTTLASVGDINFIVDSNDNGTDSFNFLNGSTNPQSGTTFATISAGGLSVNGDIYAHHQAAEDATTKAEMLSYSVASFRPHSTNSGTLAIAQVDSGNSVGMQFTNGAGTANWDISLQPFGGGVGINTVAPGGALHVYSGTSERFLISGDVHVQGSTDLNINGASRRLSFTSGTGTVRTTTANNLYLQTNSTTAIDIDSNQKVLVGPLLSSNNISTLDVVHLGYVGAQTGAFRIKLPGTHSGNWSMIVLEITVYEYNSNEHCVYHVSGHDWTTGWYNAAVTKIGTGKDIRFGYDANEDVILIGDTTSTWSYPHVTVRVMAHPSFYSGNMDLRGDWAISLITDDSGYTINSHDNRLVWNSSNDGSGSGLDADKVDGLQATSFLRSDADDSFSGNLTSGGSSWIKFYHANQTDSNDGKIGSGVFDSGLNIVGTQTVEGTGRQVRVWGSLITSGDEVYWHSGNDGSGSGLDADTVDGVEASSFVQTTGDQTISGTKTFDNASIVISGTHGTISFMDTTSGEDNFYLHANSNNFYVLVDRDGTDAIDGGYESPHPLQLEGDTNTAYTFGNRILTTADSLNADTVDGIHAVGFVQRQSELAASINLNDYITTGIYHQDSNSDATSGTNYPVAKAGLLEVYTNNDSYGNGVHTYQRYSQYDSNDLWFRKYYNGTWGSWTKNINGDNIASQSVSYATSAGTATNLGSDYTADDWIRATSDDNPVKFYGNTRQMTFRTDGTTEAYSGIGNYAFVWTYGGSSASNRRMLLASDGRLWTDYHGWMDEGFVSATADDTKNGHFKVYSTIGAADNVRDGLAHYDTTAMASGVGGQLVLGYKYTSAGAYTEGAIIKMYKENGTSGEYGSGIKFQVRNTGVNLSTKMTLDPSGNLSVTGSFNASGLVRSGQNVYTDANYGYGLVGVYSATRYQGVFAMGDAYKLAADGQSTGTLYGIAWTHQNIGGESISGLGHQMLIMSNGDTRSAMGDGVWTKYDMIINDSPSYWFKNGNAWYGRNHAYNTAEIRGYGQELMIGSQGTELHINYRTCNSGTANHTPTTWHWRAGSSTSYATHNFGTIGAAHTGELNSPGTLMRMNAEGFIFGGANSGRETNSAQISAGWHQSNSLNIVGMSTGTSSSTRRVDMWAEGGFHIYGSIIPRTNNTYDLGSSGAVWRNIYTGDLHLSNMGQEVGNDIDGTKGDWTFQEGEEDLFLINNNNGKKFRINLEEV